MVDSQLRYIMQCLTGFSELDLKCLLSIWRIRPKLEYELVQRNLHWQFKFACIQIKFMLSEKAVVNIA